MIKVKNLLNVLSEYSENDELSDECFQDIVTKASLGDCKDAVLHVTYAIDINISKELNKFNNQDYVKEFVETIMNHNNLESINGLMQDYDYCYNLEIDSAKIIKNNKIIKTFN